MKNLFTITEEYEGFVVSATEVFLDNIEQAKGFSLAIRVYGLSTVYIVDANGSECKQLTEDGDWQ